MMFLFLILCVCVCAGMCVHIHTQAWIYVMWYPVIDLKCLLQVLSTLLVFEMVSLAELEVY